MEKQKVNRRRSISMSDELWNKILKECKDCYSVSEFIRRCVEEKLN